MNFLDIQKDIFSTLNCSKHIGVMLNNSMLISPSKSVTALIGIYDERN
jgi:cobalamin-dependent methionine synthase I